MERHVPGSTYRLQLNAEFPLGSARRLLSYLERLGITDVYLSPVFSARPGSTHGYDTIDPSTVSPELGGPAAFHAFCRDARARGMGVLLDIVPNHMAASEQGPWWRDVLENGRSSPYARHFDVFWPDDPAAPHRILLPVLGRPYAEARQAGELTLAAEETGLTVVYGERSFPLDPGTWPIVLGEAGPAPLRRVLRDLSELPPREPPAAQRAARAGALGRRLLELYRSDDAVRRHVDERLQAAVADGGDDGLLDRVLAAQAYRLEFWRLAGAEISYRRFFDIGDLIGVRVEDPDVFEATHALVLEWVRAGLVTGVRIDHVDGLHDPTGYLRHLRARLDEEAARAGHRSPYLVVEKILSGAEEVPAEWPVDGTTGYDFLDSLNDVFVDMTGLDALDEVWTTVTGMRRSFDELVRQKKKLVLDALFGGEMAELIEALARIAAELRLEVSAGELRAVIAETTAALPVYRTYVRAAGVPQRDRGLIGGALTTARASGASTEAAFDAVRRTLLLELPADRVDELRERCLHFVLRWQQLSGPAMAKGLEDTALYVYNRLISLNVVGGDPGDEERSVRAFHRDMRLRAKRWPGTMNATATHDSKRGEDTRVRIHVLSVLHAEWEERLNRWRTLAAPLRRRLGGRTAPEPAKEVLLFQTLVGAWPIDDRELTSFRPRVREYALKAAREAKTRTSWTEPDEEYESALLEFVADLLAQPAFLDDMRDFQRRIAAFGAVNSLSQLIIKTTAPGVPDFYRGTELWDLSLVDPDNRRPVDFGLRERLLDELESLLRAPAGGDLTHCMGRWQDGGIKLALTALLLRFRRARRDLFRHGDYRAVHGSGPRAENVCAFLRTRDGEAALTVATRLPARLWPDGAPAPAHAWRDTLLLLPESAPRRWRDVLTGSELSADAASGDAPALRLSQVLAHLPVALLATP
jgi:(1->4)-alpha-D-glucan 1-alpha-D-glucosylmutase